jgi:hypothetical protein
MCTQKIISANEIREISFSIPSKEYSALNCIYIYNYKGLESIRTLDFVGFQEPVLDGTLNLKKKGGGFQNRFLRTLNFKNGSKISSLEP